MKEGLCETVARENATADGEGSPSTRIAEEPAVFVLDTSIDLAGNPCRQQLTMDERQLMAGNLAGNRRPEHGAGGLGSKSRPSAWNRPSARISCRCRSAGSGSTSCAGRAT